MSGPLSLNIEYIFARLYDLLTGVHLDLTGVPGEIYHAAVVIAVLGIVIAAVLLVSVVYVRIRTLQVEHAGFHGHDHHAAHEHHEPSPEPKNERWEAVVALVNSPNESDWRRAILEADVMLSAMLTERGYTGATLADQLKSANPLQFTTLDLAWEAHRMRNALAHLGEAFPLSERDARATIDLYRRVFEEFGYI